MTKNELKAYQTWKAQRQRCNNKNATSYQYWGGKGIKVEYGSREFVHWFLLELKKFKGKDPVVSRLDHSKNYCFSNVRLETRVDNSIDSHKRNIHKIVKTVFARKIGNKSWIKFSSIREASMFTGVEETNISRRSSGVYRSLHEKSGYEFKRSI